MKLTEYQIGLLFHLAENITHYVVEAAFKVSEQIQISSEKLTNPKTMQAVDLLLELINEAKEQK